MHLNYSNVIEFFTPVFLGHPVYRTYCKVQYIVHDFMCLINVRINMIQLAQIVISLNILSMYLYLTEVTNIQFHHIQYIRGEVVR